MIRTVVQCNLYIDYGIACKHTGLHSALNTCVNRSDVFLRNSTADDVVYKFVALVNIRLNVNLNMTVLTFTAGLTRILRVRGRGLANGFAVSNLRLTNIGFHLKFTKQTVNDNLQMELAHTGDNGLTGFFIGVAFKGRVFFSKLLQTDTHLFLTRFGFRLNRNTDNRLREVHGFQNNGMLLIAERVTCGGILKTDCCGDVACIADLNIFTVICMHLQNTAHALTVILNGVINTGAGFNRTRIDTEVANLTDIGVSGNLECQSRKRLVIGRMAHFFFVGVGVYTLNCLNIGRRGHIIDDCIQQRLYTLVTVRSTAGNRHHAVFNRRFANNAFNICNGDFLAVEIFFHQFVILLDNML